MKFIKKFYWFRVFVIIIIPIIFGSYLYFSPPYKFELKRINVTTNSTGKLQVLEYSPNSEYFYKQLGLSNFLSDIFHIPLDLKFIYYCFQDKGTYLEYFTTRGTEKDFKNFNWTLNFNDERNLTVYRNATVCERFYKNKKFHYNWALNGDIRFIVGHTRGLTFHPDTTSYAKKDYGEVTTKFFTLVLAWMALCGLLFGVWNIVRRKSK